MSNPALVIDERAGEDAPAFWTASHDRSACPVCRSQSEKKALADTVLHDARVALSGALQTPLRYLRCGECGVVFMPGAESLHYESDDGAGESLRYYLEEGAGIDLMIEPFGRLDLSQVRHYAEIGCSFGFSLDLARTCLDWDVRGIDPSPSAAVGRDTLNLPIECRYFTEAAPLGYPNADLLQAAEVIEHLPDPHGFMRALANSLADHGVLVISTPNAASLRAGVADSKLMQILQPGMHVTLFTASSLVAVAKSHGLGVTEIHETADDVTLYASRQPFTYRADRGCDRTLYLAYLERRLPGAPAGTPLRRGLQSRLVRELTLQNKYDRLDAVLPDVFAEYRSAGLDLANPASLAQSPAAPHNVAALLYCLGMREVIARRDLLRAIAYFDATVAWQSRARAPLAIGGVADASGETLARLACLEASNARMELDPQTEHDRMAAESLSASQRQLLFSELVNRGDLARASAHYHAVAAAADGPEASGTDSGDAARGLRRRTMTYFTLGIFALNHRGDRTLARRWFTRAIDVSDLDPGADDIRVEAALALSRSGDVAAPKPVAQIRAGSGGRFGAITRRLFAKPPATQEIAAPAISFAELSEMPDPSLLPPLDRPDADNATLTPEQRAWRRDGLVILPKFLPAFLTDPYIERRAKLQSTGGWLSAAPYLQVPELKALALYPPLMRMLESLIGEPMLLHLALTGWISTERNWHQDDYLNPPFVNGWYAAIWMALDRIDPASGPFEYVPGSHRWPLLRGDKVRGFLTDEERTRTEAGVNHWPKYSERYVAPAIDAEIARQGIPAQTFLGEKGDVLIWHGRLMHRGSLAAEPGRERRSLITHYSGIGHRPDMLVRAQDENGQHHAVFDIPLH